MLDEIAAVAIDGTTLSLGALLRQAQRSGQLTFLQSAIHGHLIERAVKGRGITVERAERDRALAVFRADNALRTDAALNAWLGQKAMSLSELEGDLEKIVAAGKLKAAIAEGRIEPYFVAHKGEFPGSLDDGARREIQLRLFREWLLGELGSARIELQLLELL